MKAPRLPRYQGGDLGAYLNDLVSQIERALTTSPSGRAYAVTNPVTKRTLDVSAGTLTDTKQVLGTLINDLKTAGEVP